VTREILWSEAALEDLDDAIAYLAARSTIAPRRVTGAIDKTLERLAEMPVGRPGRVSGTYEMVVTGTAYIIAYALARGSDGREQLVVLRVVHGARNWPHDGWPN
jgi:toxin ParE1/3/4